VGNCHRRARVSKTAPIVLLQPGVQCLRPVLWLYWEQAITPLMRVLAEHLHLIEAFDHVGRIGVFDDNDLRVSGKGLEVGVELLLKISASQVILITVGLAIGYLALSFTGLLLQQYEDTVSGIAFPAQLGEVVFMLWLLVMGAKVQAMNAPTGESRFTGR